MKNLLILTIFFYNISFTSCKVSSTRDEYADQNKSSGSEKVRPEETPEETPEDTPEAEYEIKEVAGNLYVVWSIIFTGDDRMLFTERNGKLRVIENGILSDKPLKEFAEVSSEGEEGLMGLAADPEYKTNKYIYLSYAYDDGSDLKVKVVRYKDNGDNLSDEKVIMDDLPAERYHAGCRLKFGPDGKLYITTGDAGKRKLAQDINNLYGKILRVNSDGTVPEDNPFPGNPVWSYGHRNAQGIDWYPGTEILFSTEHGPSGFDGPGGGDEVNLIVKGGNYGWPEVSHKESKEGMISPLSEFTPAIAPASGMFYSSDAIPQFKNNFFFGCLRGSGIMRVVLDETDPEKIISAEMMPDVDFGRIREVMQGPDGSIYFSTSNRDGRGRIRENDDKIYKIVKKQ
ncbi:MAG TPA: PQQ-dependent sugar dehydrogenase [Ignavibacteria bacterium]|nr:PQQ-dependent sugar dehydrogenase [Ignavibacteria bacterium]